ncbi:uncharacterized protein LOC135818285 [Sycon ciliatum]|uniref:uncharacterized protein LOC135818285 n=1 Tax=Sycon ciliatum TaxID=27933 RepID=UPI0031F6E71D
MVCRLLGRALRKAANAADVVGRGQRTITAADTSCCSHQHSRCMSSTASSSRSVNLKSDTVTEPTPEMRQAMLTAQVGDDVYGEDPSVDKLQKTAAKMFGMEKALFVPSGTMGNLISLMVHCWERGAEVLLGDRCHILLFEQGGLSQVAGVHPREVKTFADGRLDLDDLRSKVREDDIHYPVTSLICLENTHNMFGGRVLRPDAIAEISSVAKSLHLPLHVDGARIFNAAAALDVPVSELLVGIDSVSVCLSKGLAAPVGSVIGGSEKFIHRATRVRKLLGGGLRQAGVLAAPGLIALEVMSKRLHEDHILAKRLSEGCHAMKELGLDSSPETTETNIVIFSLDKAVCGYSAAELVDALGEEDPSVADESGKRFLLFAISDTQVRAVTHYQLTLADIEAFLARLRRTLSRR